MAKREYIPTTDVCLVTLDGYRIETADEYNVEPITEEGTKQDLIIKGQLVANKETPTIIKGYDIKLKDNAVRPTLMQKLMGGTLTTPDANFVYNGPNVGALQPTKITEVCVYTEVVDVGGATGEYIKVSYSNCIGDLVNFSFKDGEYFSNEFTIKSRPTNNSPVFKMELVSELPVA